MESIFLKILNMSINASWLVLAIIILRFILKKAPKAISVFMWALVGVRLICPFSFESVLSLIPSDATIPEDIIFSNAPAIDSGVITPVIWENLEPIASSTNPVQKIALAFSVLWIVGIAIMLLYTVISYIHIHRKIREGAPYEDNILLCDHIDTPFIFGVIRPRICLPSNILEQDIEYVIAHEKAHIKRHDHWWKPLGFLLLSVYWFNPIIWIAYILLCRDIELACDEKVIKDMGAEIKKPYSDALINCSVPRKMISACPLAFGEVCVKGRVKSVLNYKKPAFWIIVVAIVACIALSVGFLTNPAANDSNMLSYPEEQTKPVAINDSNMLSFIEKQIIKYNRGKYTNEEFYCTDFKVLGTKKNKENTSVYMWVLYSEYDEVNGKIEDVSGSHIPTVITVKKTDDQHYELVEYWEPGDGSCYVEDIKEKFPWYLHSKALDSQRYIKEQQDNCDKKAQEYFYSSSTVGGATGPVNVITTANIEQLKSKYPMYFDLSTTKGLEVYIWQMAEGSYSCGLLSGKNGNYTQEELFDLHKSSASLDEMRTIVASYMPDIAKSDVTICPIQMPHSSYAYNIDEAYREKITNLFWDGFPIIETTSYQVR